MSIGILNGARTTFVDPNAPTKEDLMNMVEKATPMQNRLAGMSGFNNILDQEQLVNMAMRSDNPEDFINDYQKQRVQATNQGRSDLLYGIGSILSGQDPTQTLIERKKQRVEDADRRRFEQEISNLAPEDQRVARLLGMDAYREKLANQNTYKQATSITEANAIGDAQAKVREHKKLDPDTYPGGREAWTQQANILQSNLENLLITTGGAKFDEGLSERARNFEYGIADYRPADKKIDEAFSQTYNKWINGEKSQMEANITNLSDKVDTLLSGEQEISGPITGRLRGSIIGDTFFSDSASFLADIDDLVFQSLKATLGAQFTEREAQALVRAAFNPNLQEEQNHARLMRLVQKVQSAYDNRNNAGEYYRANGTLKGFEPEPFDQYEVQSEFLGFDTQLLDPANQGDLISYIENIDASTREGEMIVELIKKATKDKNYMKRFEVN